MQVTVEMLTHHQVQVHNKKNEFEILSQARFFIIFLQITKELTSYRYFINTFIFIYFISLKAVSASSLLIAPNWIFPILPWLSISISVGILLI